MIAYASNDNVVRLTGARAVSLATGVSTYLTGAASVTFRVQTETYVDVPGETWPLSMTYIAGSDGNFIGVLRNEVVLSVGAQYRFIGVVDAGNNQFGTWDIPLPVLRRD